MIFFFFNESLLDRSGLVYAHYSEFGPFSPSFSRCRLPAPNRRGANRDGTGPRGVNT
jgi:hypothetical protein